MVLGLPCSGKSRFIEKLRASESFVWVDIDRLARQLPEYQPIAAMRFYGEAADIGGELLGKALRGNRSIVIESVGRDREVLLRLLVAIRWLGYRCELCVIKILSLASMKRAIARLKDPEDGLFIEPAYIAEDLRVVPYMALLESNMFDKWSIFETSKEPGGEPKLVRSGVTKRRTRSPSCRTKNGLDWAQAWEDKLADAAQEVAAEVFLGTRPDRLN